MGKTAGREPNVSKYKKFVGNKSEGIVRYSTACSLSNYLYYAVGSNWLRSVQAKYVTAVDCIVD